MSLALMIHPHLVVVLGQQLLAQLDVLVLGLLLGGTGVNNLLPFVVLGLALIILSVIVLVRLLGLDRYVWLAGGTS